MGLSRSHRTRLRRSRPARLMRDGEMVVCSGLARLFSVCSVLVPFPSLCSPCLRRSCPRPPCLSCSSLRLRRLRRSCRSCLPGLRRSCRSCPSRLRRSCLRDWHRDWKPAPGRSCPSRLRRSCRSCPLRPYLRPMFQPRPSSQFPGFSVAVAYFPSALLGMLERFAVVV